MKRILLANLCGKHSGNIRTFRSVFAGVGRVRAEDPARLCRNYLGGLVQSTHAGITGLLQ
jgi:hypothetical protein